MSKYQQIAEIEKDIEDLEDSISQINGEQLIRVTKITIELREYSHSWQDRDATFEVLRTIVLKELRAKRDELKEKRQKLIGSLNVSSKKKRWFR